MSVINLDLVLNIDDISKIDYERGKDGVNYTTFIFTNNRPPLVLALTERESLIFQKKLSEAHLRKEIDRLNLLIVGLKAEGKKTQNYPKMKKELEQLLAESRRFNKDQKILMEFISNTTTLLGINDWSVETLENISGKLHTILREYNKCISDRDFYKNIVHEVGEIIGDHTTNRAGAILTAQLFSTLREWKHEREIRQTEASVGQTNVGLSSLSGDAISCDADPEGSSVESESNDLANDGK